jgi:hypothetical protein
MSGNRAIKLMQRRQKTGIVAPARMGAHRKTSLHGDEAQTCSPARSRGRSGGGRRSGLSRAKA